VYSVKTHNMSQSNYRAVVVVCSAFLRPFLSVNYVLLSNAASINSNSNYILATNSITLLLPLLYHNTTFGFQMQLIGNNIFPFAFKTTNQTV